LQGPAEPISVRQISDADARKSLLEEHLPEVRYIARRIHGRLPLHVPLEDLVHDGVLGLIDAIDKFDPLKQVQLKSYAKFRIRGAILDSLRASDWSPRSLRRQARRLQEVHRQMSAALNRTPTETELARQLGMNLPALQQLLADLRGLDVASLGSHYSENVQGELSFNQAGPADADPFSLCLREEMKSHLARVLDDLDDRERRILELYYRDELTMKEVGAVLGIGESRVSQIHSAAMLRLRNRLQARLRSSPAA
jgi:RNA polymerase sigma factor for flagellar operon FliA